MLASLFPVVQSMGVISKGRIFPGDDSHQTFLTEGNGETEETEKTGREYFSLLVSLVIVC
jgi:hypothetical protein